MIAVWILLETGNQIIHQALGWNFHPPPGGVAIGEIVAPLVVGFPGDLAFLQGVRHRLPFVQHPVDLSGLWILPNVYPEAHIAVRFIYIEAIAVFQCEKCVHKTDVGIDIRHRNGMRRDAKDLCHLCRQVGLWIPVLGFILGKTHIGGICREAQQLPEMSLCHS